MARRLSAVNRTFLSNLSPSSPLPNPNPNPNLCTASSGAAAAAASILPFLSCKRRKKLRKKIASPRVAPIQREPSLRVDALDVALDRDAAFRFLNRARSFLARLPLRSLPLPAAGSLFRELGFPRGRKVSRYALRHPLLFHLPASPGLRPHLAFTPLMDSLLAEERALFDALEPRRVQAVRKLLMLSARRRVPLAKLHHCRGVLGLPDDFRDRVRKYPDCFRVAVDPDGRHVLELARWDPALAVSALERSFVADESRARRTFKFPLPHRKALPLDEDDAQRLDSLTTLPLISPYSDGSTLTPWSVDAEKYRVGIIHEFLSLTLEKRASIHHIVEFKEEFSLTRHTYQMLLKQPRAFYLAGTEMNWTVFLRDAYGDDGALIDKDPQVLFNEKLERYASCTAESDPE
ncbi:Protein ROOT PRIMORDIUM DEFECTIVE 1 [Ananas comosus]|uniref:Protein ROOT PRIMORDIUM DEFECTIVE 1 n=1 Tax=Ananas comosus TaxID=4615 RepID=A0A199VM89_ANACO|nr:Protein ROOT PRIMORDIUM DEFECTIVE 1 [Ananas comosus]